MPKKASSSRARGSRRSTSESKPSPATPVAEAPATIRHSLVNLLNEIDALLLSSRPTKEEREQLIKLRRLLHALLDEVLRREIAKDTKEYFNAIKRANDATDQATKALKNLESVARAIEHATSAAKAIDRVVKFVSGALA